MLIENAICIEMTKKELLYSGRIGWTEQKEPLFVFPASLVMFHFYGTGFGICLTNWSQYWDSYLGVIIDGVQKKIKISHREGSQYIEIADKLDDKEHEVVIFKRMDNCHQFVIHHLLLSNSSRISPAPIYSGRKIEVYGDSVSAGEVAEAVEYTGKEDPKHQGEFSNSYYSYAWILARKLNARLHDIAQGGIALMDKTGWFLEPNAMGMESIWDKVSYNPFLGNITFWDFSKYQPQVVIIAIGQNDSHPIDYMARDIDSKRAKEWKCHYRDFVKKIRSVYKKALIVLQTTLLYHHENWDRAIHEVCEELQDKRVVHYIYKRNGKGTPGHLRIAEAEEMAEELAAFLESFGDSLWEGEVNE